MLKLHNSEDPTWVQDGYNFWYNRYYKKRKHDRLTVFSLSIFTAWMENLNLLKKEA